MRDMTTEAASVGFYESPGWGKKYPRIQILTIAELLRGTKRVEMPSAHGTFKEAGRVEQSGVVQLGFED
jgi:site-specific DNA-methyltransferase (adenine-specific)